MRKTLLYSICVIMIIIICAGCASNNKSETETNTTEPEADATEESIHETGDTIVTDIFECTLTDLKFVDALNVKAGENFFTPAEEGMIGGEGYKLLYYSFRYKFVGKTHLDSRMCENALFLPSVSYKDYKIDNNYFVFWRKKGDDWHGYASDISWSIRENMGLAYPSLTYSYEPLEDKVYESRGVISVPSKAYEDTETPMNISFQILNSVENNNYSYIGYTFKVR